MLIITTINVCAWVTNVFTELSDSTTPDDLVTALEGMGHNITIAPSLGVCGAMQYLDGKITFYGDKRDEEDSAQIF